MKVEIKKSTPNGTILAPPSKSMAHRMLICAGLSKGRSVIHSIAPSQDILATLDCLKALGASYTYEDNTVIIDRITSLSSADKTLYCRESGSTLRFFLPICLASEGKTTLFGSETLLKRPLNVYEDICQNQSIGFSNDGEKITVNGKLSGGEFTVAGNISSQFISGLLFTLPLLNTDSIIKIIPPIESMSYIKMTIDALKTFGVMVKWLDENTLSIKGNQAYMPKEVCVEGDYSNAAFFMAMNYLGGSVTISGLNESSLQGDKVCKELFESLDKENATIDISDCPDLGPILFAFASAKNGGTFTGTKRLKIKESDRASAMAEELQKVGVKVDVLEDTVIVNPISFHAPDEVLSGHNDHRIVMSLCVLLTLVGGEIDGAEAVSKSMPDFFEYLEKLNVDLHIVDRN